MTETRLARYVSSLRRYYRIMFCSRVNNPQECLSPGDKWLWEHKDLYPGWREKLSEDPDFPLQDIADAIKKVVRGEEDRNLELFKEGAKLLIEMDHKYKPRDVLDIDSVQRWNPKSETFDTMIAKNPPGEPMLCLTTQQSLYWEGEGYVPPSFWDLIFLGTHPWVEMDDQEEPPYCLNEKAVEEAWERLREGKDDAEMFLYRIERETNPEWKKSMEGREQKMEKYPYHNKSVGLFLQFREYLLRHAMFLHLGVCHAPGCGKLYVKSKYAPEKQRYCPAHKRARRQ